MKRPNIIFCFTDQQRWDTMGCYGQKLDVTPNLDRIAAEGTLFENAFTCQPVCGPARACLQTGRYPTETGCYRNGEALPFGKYKTLAEYFNEAGYQTAYVGKWHLASQEGGADYHDAPVPVEKRGGYKDYWMASDVLEWTSHGYNGHMFDGNNQKMEFVGYRPDCINAYAIDFLHSRNPERPFFLFVSHIDPHHQNDRNRYEGPDGSRHRFRDYEAPADLKRHGGDWQENYPDYLGQCHSIDENVGRLVDTLQEYGLWENTVLVYTSDHGSHFRTRNAEYKRSCHDSCTHIPLLIHGPGFNTGARITEMVSLMDIPTTLLDCAGLSKPGGFQGNSIKQLVSGTAQEWKQAIFLQISESQIGRALRTHRWKYAVRALGDGNTCMDAQTYYEDCLYDLCSDPTEWDNLVDEPGYEGIRLQLREEMKRLMGAARERPPIILPHSMCPEA